MIIRTLAQKLLLLAFFAIGVPAFSINLDSLKVVLHNTPPDTNKVWLLRDIAYYYQYESGDSALKYSNEGFKLATALQHTEGQIWNLYQSAIAYELKDRADSALIVYDNALGIARSKKSFASEAKLLNSLGVLHYYAGDFPPAIDYYTRAFSIADSIGYTTCKAQALNNLGVIYRLQRRYDRAIDIYQKSLQLKEAEGDEAGVVNTLYNIGLAHSYLASFDTSIHYLQQAKLRANLLPSDAFDIPNIDLGLGVAYYNLNDFNSARHHLQQGLGVAHRERTPEWMSGLAYIGAMEVKVGNHENGLALIKESLLHAIESGRKEIIKRILLEQARSASLAGAYQLASESWEQYAEIIEELNAESQEWALEEMQARYELKDKEITIALQKLDLETQTTKQTRYLITSGFMFLLILIGGGFITYTLKQRNRLAIEVGLKEQALEENAWLFQELHHRTKNNLQLLSSLLNLQSRSAQHPDTKAALQNSRDTVGAIGLLHNHMLHTESKGQVSLVSYVNELLNNFTTAFNLKERQINLKCECDELELSMDTAIPLALILNELLTNALKHAFSPVQGGEVLVQIRLTDNSLVLRVVDDGLGNQKSESLGAGSKMIEILRRKLNARFERKFLNHGTSVSLEMPFQNQL